MRFNSDDLKLVKQLEKETGITLERISLEKIGNWQVIGFAADNNGRVRGLAIWGKNCVAYRHCSQTFND